MVLDELDNLAEKEENKDIVVQMAVDLREKWGDNFLHDNEK